LEPADQLILCLVRILFFISSNAARIAPVIAYSLIAVAGEERPDLRAVSPPPALISRDRIGRSSPGLIPET